MDIKQLYREETELDVYTVALMEQRVEHFSDDYVKWLEAKINYTRCCEELCENEEHNTIAKLEDVYRCKCGKLKIY